MGGVWGSWLGVILVVIVLIAQFYVVSPDQVAASMKHGSLANLLV